MIPVQERGHGVAVNRLTGAVRAVVPALRDALFGQPRDFLVELAVGRNICKRRPGGCRKLRGTRIPVEERRHRITVHRGGGAERAVTVAGGDAAGSHPLNLLIERVIRGHITKRRLRRRRKLRRTIQTIEERRHRPALHVLARAECPIRVAERNLPLRQPVNLCIELVIGRNILKPGVTAISGCGTHLNHLGTLTMPGTNATQITGAVMHMQEQGLSLKSPRLPVRRQLSTSTVSEEPRHTRRLALKPHLRRERVERGLLRAVHIIRALIQPGVREHGVANVLRVR